MECFSTTPYEILQNTRALFLCCDVQDRFLLALPEKMILKHAVLQPFLGSDLRRSRHVFALCYRLSPNSSSNGRSNQTPYLEHVEELAAKMRRVWTHKTCTHTCVCNGVVSEIMRTARRGWGSHSFGGSHVPSSRILGGHMCPPLKIWG